MKTPDDPVLRVECPCCGARLSIDIAQGVVLEGVEPGHARKETDLKDAERVLREESSRIDERFRRIAEADKGRGAEMEKKFKDFLEKSGDEPAPRPLRDIDLD